MIPFLLWLVAVELLGLAALPLTMAFFPRLADRGYALSKTLGILVITWLNWLLGLSLEAANIVVVLWVLAAGIAALGMWALRRTGDDARVVVRGIWRSIAVEEGLFLVAFSVWAAVRAYHPDIYGTEKPMDLMYLTTSMEHRHFPPPDLWLSGTMVNYYYLGYLAMGTVANMAGVSAPVAFNLALALLFGLTLSSAYALGRTLTRSYVWAALAAAFVGLAGNLSGWMQMWANRSSQTPDWGAFNWCASRVIGGCAHYTTINEFPFFSFVWGDLHPHVIALPFALLCVAIALHSVLSSEEGWRAFGSPPTAWLMLGLAAVALGSMYAINSWDLPAYLLLVMGGLVFGPFKGAGVSLVSSLRSALPVSGLLVVLSVGLWLPFWLTYHSSAQGIGFQAASTNIGEYLTINGAFLVPLVVALLVGEWPLVRRLVSGTNPATRASPALGIMNTSTQTGETNDDLPPLPVKPVLAILVGTVVLALLVLRGNLTVLALLFLAVIAYHVLKRESEADPAATFAWLATSLGLGLTILCEFVYLRDIFAGGPNYRMNTVFKFYYEMWVLFALGAAWACATLWRRVYSAQAGQRVTLGRIGCTTLLAAIVVTSGTYTVLAVPHSGGSAGVVPTLDGMGYLKTLSPGDYAAITWLRSHAPRDAVVAEAVGGDYWGFPPPDRPGQVAIFSRLPTLLEAAGSHEGLWHPGNPLIAAHQGAATAIYGPDPSAAQAAIAANHVRYVYVGPQEAQTYANGNSTAPNLTKFAHFMRKVYHANGVTIYQT
jgi:YYY domain-containing protein